MERIAKQDLEWTRENRLPSLGDLEWLRSAEGRAACRAMATDQPADTPAAIAHWRERLPPARVSTAWAQVLLRHSAVAKFSRAEEMLFDRVGLEQSTDEAIAAHKAQRFAGRGRIADLCCGIGGDTLALAAVGDVVAVDRAGARTEMAAHNASVYGRRISTSSADVSLELPPADAAHIDPDRRPTGRRSHELEDSSPGRVALERIVAHYRNVAIKLSPGAKFDTLPFPAEVELISHHGECKQAVAWTGALASAHRRATVLLVPRIGSPGSADLPPPLRKGGVGGVAGSAPRPPAVAQLSAQADESLEWPASQPPAAGRYLYEPDPAVIRAHLVGVLATQLELAPIDAHIAWLIGDAALESPFMRGFRILDTQPWSAKSARAWLARHDIGPLDVKTRGFAGRPEAILKQLRPTGQRSAVLFLTRLDDRPTAILAERLSMPES